MITSADDRPQAPRLLVGVTYNFEPVPTDVEAGPRRRAVRHDAPRRSRRPPASPPRGSVYRLSDGHHLKRLATGFSGATNLAITTSGRILVAELFAGRISTIEHGKPAPVLDLPGVASVEFYRPRRLRRRDRADGRERRPRGPGKVVKISVRW